MVMKMLIILLAGKISSLQYFTLLKEQSILSPRGPSTYGIYYLNHLLCVSILSLSLNTCAIFIGGTITTASLFIYKSIMFNTTIHVVIQPSGFMVRDFHWKYMSYFH